MLAATWSFDASALPKTVCTVTINSSDEKDAFQRHLPRGEYRFVELVQRGQPDWLASARRRGVSCDVLLISGHFDDGTEFYTDRFDDREFLTVLEMQHESCSASGDGLFSRLKEVYLFGCNTLKSEPRHVASSEVARSLGRSGHSPADAERLSATLNERYGQSNRDRPRRASERRLRGKAVEHRHVLEHLAQPVAVALAVAFIQRRGQAFGVSRRMAGAAQAACDLA